MAEQSNEPLPLSLGDDDKPKKNVSRGIQGGTAVMSSLSSMNQFEAPRAIRKGAQTTATNELSFGGGGDSVFSFGHKHPVQIITLELDDAPKQKQAAPLIEVKPDVQAQALDLEAPDGSVPYTNDLRSYAVKGQSPSQVLSGLTAVLVNYSQDMDIRLDEAHGRIEGVVFVENYYGIKFEINIWAEDAETTRFELTRDAGDALATSKFLGDIKTKFFIDMEQSSEAVAKLEDQPSGFNLISLSVDIDSLDLKELFRQLTSDRVEDIKEEEDNISQQELEDIHEVLSNNEQDSVDELQFLHSRLKENGAIGKDIVSHEQLVKTIIGEAMKNSDICVVRGCLLILEQLCVDGKIQRLLVEQYALFENLVTLLGHQYALIKNYSVRLLARLSREKETKWNADKQSAQNIEKLVRQYQDEWTKSILANNGFLNKDMFDSIYAKLAECQ